MKTLKILGITAAALASLTSQAQQTQTAEGAQRFLALLVKDGHAQAWFVDAQGRTNPVPGLACRTGSNGATSSLTAR